MDTPASLPALQTLFIRAQRLGLILGAATLLTVTASAAIVYDQPFTNTSGSEKSISVVTDWATYAAADGTASTGVRVQTARTGALYVPSSTTGFVIRGTDVSLSLSSAAQISINTIQTGSQARFQFMIQIDNANWYLSNTVFTPVTSASWDAADTASLDYGKSLGFTLDAADWSLFGMTGTGVTSTALSADLSGTTITGIGLLAKGSTVSRYDDLRVSSIPEPGTWALLTGSAGLVAAFVLRRRNRA